METSHPNKAIVALIVVALLGLTAAGIGYVVTSNKSNATDDRVGSVGTDKPSSVDTTNTTYKDGTYSASAQYVSPGGSESVDLSVELKTNKIVSADVTTHPASSTSSQYQGIFKDNFRPEVIGKSINEVELHRVAGSSLTSGGFNAALEKIKTQAEK